MARAYSGTFLCFNRIEFVWGLIGRLFEPGYPHSMSVS